MNNKQYYVYELIDPRTNLPFYIGKGKGKRIDQHEKEARKGIKHPKCDVINDIKNSGLQVSKRIVKWFDNEPDAYNFEEKHINDVGLDNLTNLVKGGRWVFPYFRKASTHEDESLIQAIAYLIRKTDRLFKEGKTSLFIKLFNQEIAISKDTLNKVIDNISKPLASHGQEWVEKEFKKHNIIIDIVSKVENYGY